VDCEDYSYHLGVNDGEMALQSFCLAVTDCYIHEYAKYKKITVVSTFNDEVTSYYFMVGLWCAMSATRIILPFSLSEALSTHGYVRGLFRK